MITTFKIIAMLGFFIAGLGWLLLVIGGFRDSFFRGLMVIFLPFYIVFYALFSYDRRPRLLPQFLFFGGLAIGIGLMLLAQNADPNAPIFR